MFYDEATEKGGCIIKHSEKGLVVKTHNRFYQILVGDKTYLCNPKGIFKKAKDPEYRLPVIGDFVNITLHKKKDKGVDGQITEILPRENRLLRADAEGRRERVMAANLDFLMIVSAVSQPGVDFPMIDRYILTCELSHIPYRLVINKTDLDPMFEEDERLDPYRDLEIPILFTSIKTGEGMDELQEWVSEGMCYLTGTSGVGKSSLINYLIPDANLSVGEVDPKKGRGRHTTTNSSLLEFKSGGYLIDSPGLRDFYPPKVLPDEVRFGFRDIMKHQVHCRFSSCLHENEPDCAVYQAVEDETLSYDRYKSYLFLLSEMQNYQQSKFS